MTMISYAQNFEDVMLWRALKGVENGFYIDVGAQDPIIDSVSLAFHEHGWTGIHVEPTPHYAQLLREQRPGDVVLEVAIGMGQNLISFFEIPDSGISTANAEVAEQHRERGFNVREITVPCIKLSSVFETCRDQEIHWMKVDVEGLELEVLKSWGKAKTKPWIVVVESTLPLTQIESHEKWEMLLTKRGYLPAYFDGLNRYYLATERTDLMKAFESPPNLFDGFALTRNSWPWCTQLKIEIQEAEQKIEAEKEASAIRYQTQEADKAFTLSLESAHRDDIAALQSEVVRMSALVIAAKDAAAVEIAVAHEDALTSAHALAGREREFANEFVSIREANRAEMSFLRDEVMRLGAFLIAAKDDFTGILHAHRLEALASSRSLVEHEREIAAKLLDAAKNEYATFQQLERQRLESIEKSYLDSEQRMSIEISKLVARELGLGAQVLAKADAYSTLQRLAHEERHEMHRHIASLRGDANLLKSEHQQRELSLLSEISESKDNLAKLQSAQIQIKDDYALSLAKSHEANVKLQGLLLAVKQEQVYLVNTLSWRLTKPFREVRERLFSYRNKNARSAEADAPMTRQTDAIADSSPTSNPYGIAPSFQQKAPMFTSIISSNASPLDRNARSISELLSLDGENFIDCAYFTILKRAPDPEGGAFYLGRLLAGIKKIQILDEISASEEAELKGVSLPGLRAAIMEPAKSIAELVEWNGEQFIECAYLTFLNRLPDTSGKSLYLDLLMNGMGKVEIINEISLSEEGRQTGVSLSGLTAAVKHEKRARQSFGRSMSRFFSGSSLTQAAETRLCAIEQQVIRLAQQSEANYASLLREFATVGEPDAMGYQTNSLLATPQQESEPTRAQSIISPQTPFTAGSAKAVIAQLAQTVLASAEAQQLSHKLKINAV